MSRTHYSDAWGNMVWGVNEDAKFLHELLVARKFVPLYYCPVVEPVLAIICDIMKETFDYPFNVAFLTEQFDSLKEHYDLFGIVVNFALVYPKSMRYFTEGESIWNELRFIFDTPEEFVHDPGVYHPSDRDEIFDTRVLSMLQNQPGEGYEKFTTYCKIYNEVYKRL